MSMSSPSPVTLTCDVCVGEFPANLVRVDEPNASVLVTFLTAYGWTCPSCRRADRSQSRRIESSLSNLTGEIDALRADVARLLRDHRQVSLHNVTRHFPYIDDDVPDGSRLVTRRSTKTLNKVKICL
jgi:hypothetical protein